MISLFIKQTTSVESQRVAQLVGNVDTVEFQRRVSEIYKFFYPKNGNSEGSASEEENLKYDICCSRLAITVLSASDLPKMDLLGSVDSFVKVIYKDTTHQTKVKLNEFNPSWKDETFYFDIKTNQTSSTDPDASHLTIAVYDWDRLGGNSFIGSSVVPSDLLDVILNTEGCSKELNLVLNNNETPVLNAIGNPSILKVSLMNAGMVISGCEVASLKEFFMIYDTDKDGNISEKEFFAMMNEICSCAMLFTGTEGGDNILEKLNPVQVSALLAHKWTLPSDAQQSTLTAIISNIQNQSTFEHESNLKGKKKLDDTKPAAAMEDFVVAERCSTATAASLNGPFLAPSLAPARGGTRSHGSVEEADVGVDQTESTDQIQADDYIEARESNHSLSKIANMPSNIVEVDQKNLSILARKLRRSGVIALPTLLWGAGDVVDLHSPENTAMRYLHILPFETQYTPNGQCSTGEWGSYFRAMW